MEVDISKNKDGDDGDDGAFSEEGKSPSDSLQPARKVNSGAEHKSLRPPSGRGRALLMKDFQSLYSVQPFTQIIPLKDIDKK